MAPESLAETLDVIKRVLRQVCERGIAAPDLEAAREHLRGSLILAHESSATRMSHLAEQALIGGELEDLDATLEALRRVESSDVRDQAAELLAEPLAVAAVGPVPAGVLPNGGLEIDA